MNVDFAKAYPVLTDFLLRQVVQGLSAHTYLFLGRRGVGKASLAEGFANALVEVEMRADGNYFQIDLEKDWKKGLHPDIVFLRPEEGESHIGIDASRRFQRTMSEKPFLSPRRVGVIVHAEALTTEAMASILKLLEEPPKNAVIILLGEAQTAFPKTILSRCQILWVPRIRDDALRDTLYLTDADEDQLVVELARGRLRFAAALRASAELRQQQHARLTEAVQVLIERRVSRDVRTRMSDAQEVAAFFDVLEILFCEVLSGHLFGTAAIRSTSVKTAYVSVSRRLTLPQLHRLEKFIAHGRELLSAHVSPQGIFEQFLAMV